MTDRFQELLDAVADQTISDEHFAELEQLINEDSELRKRFLDYQNLCGSLEEKALRDGESRVALNLQKALESEGLDGSLASVEQVSLPDRDKPQRRPSWRRVLSAAAVLLVGLMIGTPLGWKLNQRAAVDVPPDTGTNDELN